MSCNYADGLSPYDNKGKLGLPEIPDTESEVLEKISILADWIRQAKHIVAHTGAGISTAAGIPDFRGPNGVWTLEKKGQKPDINISFDMAQPTLTHLVLKKLQDDGLIQFIISQNIDGLHLRSGVERTKLAELHGNMFVAKCQHCGNYFVQPHALPTVGQKEIGKDCEWSNTRGRPCRGKLHDTLLDWEESLPDAELETAEINASLADLSISLGTTLQIVPAGNLPLNAKKNPGGKLVIINLQETKQDKKADLIIHAKVDFVMEHLCKHLEIDLKSITYNQEQDPTKIVKESGTSLRWTIPAHSLKKLRKEFQEFKKDKAQAQKRKLMVKNEEENSVEVPVPLSLENKPALKLPKPNTEEEEEEEHYRLIPLPASSFQQSILQTIPDFRLYPVKKEEANCVIRLSGSSSPKSIPDSKLQNPKREEDGDEPRRVPYVITEYDTNSN